MDNQTLNPLRKALWYFVPTTLFALYTTYYAWRHGGEITVFLGLSLVFGSVVAVGIPRTEEAKYNLVGLLLATVGLLLFIFGALFTPTQQ